MDDKAKRGRRAAVTGHANEHIVAGILMKRYENVSLVDLPLSSFDLIIVFKNKNGEEIIRAQVKTIGDTSLSFTGGTRGGVDRKYKSGVKSYTQTSKTSDLVIGIKEADDKHDLYFVPTILIEKMNQKSISINKIKPLKNNKEILEKCKEHDFILDKCKKFGLI